MFTLAQLQTALSPDEVLAALIQRAEGLELPATAWQTGSVPRTLFQLEGEVLSDVIALVAAIADGGFLDTATRDWLTRLASKRYGIDRAPATVTTGTIRLTNPSGGGAHAIAVGALTFRSDGGKLFENTASGTLASGPSTLDLAIRATSPGAAHNVPVGSIRTMVTPLPGVTCDNLSTWRTAQGTDEEGDALLKQRCRDAWAALGTGSTDAVYRLWAREASAEVTRVRAAVNPAQPGLVGVVVAGPAGAVTAGVVATVQAYIDARVPLTALAEVESASEVEVAPQGTVFVTGGSSGQTAATAAIEAALTALISETDIGGTVYLSRIIDAIQSSIAVRNFAPAPGFGDTPLLAAQVPTLTLTGLSYQQV
jgi:uncharacterized phage protein gp47/JayE